MEKYKFLEHTADSKFQAYGKDLEEAFADIPIDKISTSLTINPVASVMLAMYLVMAEKQGIPWEEYRICKRKQL